MRIFIPYKHTTGEELRLCLRSIEKNLTGFDDVILITDKKPDWYIGETLRHLDVSTRKELNIISKLFQVKDEKFIRWCDDIFLLKPLKVSEIKNWYQGRLSEALQRAQGKYYEAIRNTIERFGDVKYYDIHTPAIFTREQIQRVFRLEWGNKDFVIKTAALCEEEGEETTDLKINRPISKEAIQELVKDRMFFSTGANGFKQQMINFLTEIFPEKSNWEK